MLASWLRSLLGTKKEENDTEGSKAPVGAADSKPVHVTDDTFQEQVLGSEVPVLVDFWAPWCQPCRMIAPIVEDLAQEYGGRAVIAKLNTDENVLIAGRLDIRGIPTLVYFKHGQEVDRVVGFAPHHILDAKLRETLG
jgi:thioredoxin 1